MKSSVKVAVIIPSRGLMFSKTAEEILDNLKGVEHKFFFSHKRPIPDCFEIPVQAALKDESITHIWLVEDDMILPPTVLKEMLDKELAVVTADYPVNSNGMGSVFSVKDRVVFCGTGCLLVRREVFEELRPPYFRTDVVWNIQNGRGHVRITGANIKGYGGYGLHDVNFGITLYQKNIPISLIDTKLGQRKLIELGKAGSNDGAHKIDEWKKILKDKRLKQIKKNPITNLNGKMTTVMTPTGEVTVSQAHAKTLIRKKLATRIIKTGVIIDDSEVRP